MKTNNYFLVFILLITIFIFSFLSKSFAGSLKARKTHLVLRGKYIVTGLGKCADCHTPIDMHGRPIMNKWLQGAVLGLKPIHPIPFWAKKSSDIAGLPKGWTKANMVKFLESGLDPKGKYARPPMPAYRMKRRDALAVTYYLLSLKNKKK